MDELKNKNNRDQIVQIIFTQHALFLIFLILMLGLGPLLRLGEDIGILRLATGIMAFVGFITFLLMRRVGAGFQKFVKRWADLIWNLYSMLTLYFVFASAIEYKGFDLKTFLAAIIHQPGAMPC